MVLGMGGENSVEVIIESSGTDTFTDAMGGAGNSLMSLRGAAIAAGGALATLGAVGFAKSIQAAANFEEQMVEVEKVTSPETAAALNDEIRRMARTMPLAHKELATIAATAGRLGVRGVDNIKEFTKQVSQIAVATDLTADEAATNFARLSKLLKEPISNVKNLGSVVNELSNNMATSSSEIVDTATRAASNLEQLGLTSTEIFGLSAALREVSNSSERAGTALRVLASKMFDPKKVEKLAAAFGMTTQEFKNWRNEAPLQIIRQMAVEIANNTEKGTAFRTILGRQASTLGKLGNNMTGLNKALKISADQYKRGTSLQKEYDTATQTFNSQMKILNNQLNDIAIQIGSRLLPYLTRFLKQVQDGIGVLAKWNRTTDGMVGVGILATAMLGGLALAIGALSTPLLVIAGLVAALAVAWKTNFGNIRGYTEQTFKGIVNLWRIHGGDIRNRMQKILGQLRKFWRRWGDEIMTVVRFAFDFISTVIVQTMDAILTQIRFTLAIINGDWAEAWDILDGFARRTLTRFRFFIHEWGGNVVDDFVHFAKRAGRAFSRWLKNAIKVPKIRIPKPELPNGVNIPGFAHGGVVTQPTLGVIGEAGPEAVIPLDRMDEMRQPGGGGETEVKVVIDAPGDDPIANYIQRNAEIVMERQETERSRRQRRYNSRPSGV